MKTVITQSPFELPQLATFHTKPSWHNRAGRTDRSACAELRASNIWKYKLNPDDAGSDGAQRRKTRVVFHLTARYFSYLQDKFPGRTLAGDERTTKSNAMRPRNINITHLRFPNVCNPNKGAAREKFLGLWHSWSQDITIIRRKLHKRLSKHFLICPGCNQRAMKLFLPMCTREEADDADNAELWLDAVENYYKSRRQTMPAETMRLRAELINRYGFLFREGRVLMCVKCYGIRYGERRK